MTHERRPGKPCTEAYAVFRAHLSFAAAAGRLEPYPYASGRVQARTVSEEEAEAWVRGELAPCGEINGCLLAEDFLERCGPRGAMAHVIDRTNAECVKAAKEKARRQENEMRRSWEAESTSPKPTKDERTIPFPGFGL